MSYVISTKDSILDILKTSKGSRIMRPNYGSDLYLLRDRTFNDEWKLTAQQNIFDAIYAVEEAGERKGARVEPRAEYIKTEFEVNAVSGKVSIIIYIKDNETGELINLEIENEYQNA